ncbi:MAG: T9SS type A sorting domain-containing protein [Bacteroidota bacterium]
MPRRSAKQSYLKSLLTFFCLGILFLTWQSLLGQDAQQTVRIKIHKEMHGESVSIDTTFFANPDQPTERIIQQIDPDSRIEWMTEEEGKEKMVFIHKSRNLSEEGFEEVFETVEGEANEMLQELEITVHRLLDGEEADIQIQVVNGRCRIVDCLREELEQLSETVKKAEMLDGELAVEELSFFPNPNDGKFRLRIVSAQEAPLELVIRDMMGKTVYREIQSAFSGQYDSKINLSHEAAGVYFLTITIQARSLTKKIVIDK